MVKTHRDRLIEDHKLNTKWNPQVECACGRLVHADMCVDLTPLPSIVREALGLVDIEFICDACQCRLFVDRYIHEAEFYGMLGAGEEALHVHNEHDNEHELGVFWRHPAHKPQHEILTHSKLLKAKEFNPLRIPLHHTMNSHIQSARWLSRKYTLQSIPSEN